MTIAAPSWVSTIDADKLQENSKVAIYPKGLPVLLIKKGEQIHAISNKCAHMACPLAGGVLEDCIIRCPCHNWGFDIKTGEFLDAKEIKIQVYQTKLLEGKIYVKI
jgi:3-phenylpropionate/trans-cinnamate dioxygenase ferredoxin subunit